MKIPNYVFPKYYSIRLIKTQKKSIPKLGFFDDFKRYTSIQKISEDVNNFSIQRSKNYHRIVQKLTLNQKAKYSIRIFDFTSNLNFDKKIQYQINEKGNFTNAWRKMFEICRQENLVPVSKKVKHFDICCMPGAFILAINHYIKTEIPGLKYDWYGQSYVDSNDKKYLTDQLGIFKNNPSKLLVAIDGDITNSENINYYKHYFRNKKRNLITSDCGLKGPETEDYTREKQMVKIFFGQFISGISVLEKDGNFLMKFYDFFSNFYLSFVYLMGLFFKEVKLIKPESSRQPRGHEVYIGCFGFKDNLTDEVYSQLLQILQNINITNVLEYSLIDINNIDSELNKKIQTGVSSYYSELLKRDIDERIFTEKIIGVKLFKHTDLYIERKIQLTKLMIPKVKGYLEDYVERMDYKQIKNKDKIN